MDRKGLAYELRWLVLFVFVALVIGLSIGAPRTCLGLAVLGFLGWHLYKLKKFEAWVMSIRRSKTPKHEFDGIWAEIADDILRLSKRYQKDKLRLQAVVSRVQEMTSALTDAVILLDSHGNIEWWNNAAQMMFDFHNIDLGHKLTNLIRHPRFVQYFEAQDYGDPLDIDSIKKNGQRLQFQIHLFGHGDKLVIVRDSTRVHKLEQMRRDFVANVSHELRTPLTVLNGYLETLADSQNLPKGFDKAIVQMQAQGERMKILIEDLITLTKLETDERDIHYEEVHLYTLLQTIFNDAKALIGDRPHTFAIKGNEEIRIKGNEKEIRSALSNLVFNAINYSPKELKVTAKIKLTPTSIAVAIRDYGIGIDPKHIPRLTERFYRVDSSRTTALGGTGLGLAIVKHVLLRHDAELKIRSLPGKGSTFTCHFPLSRVVEAEENAA